MKKTGLEDIYRALRDEKHEIEVDVEIMNLARRSLERMLNIS
jgi:quinolinate synthase